MTPHLTQEVLPVGCIALIFIDICRLLKNSAGRLWVNAVKTLLPVTHIRGDKDHRVGGGVLQDLRYQTKPTSNIIAKTSECSKILQLWVIYTFITLRYFKHLLWKYWLKMLYEVIIWICLKPVSVWISLIELIKDTALFTCSICSMVFLCSICVGVRGA